MDETIEIAKYNGVILMQVNYKKNKKTFPINYIVKNKNTSEERAFYIDGSNGWETMKKAYELAVSVFNSLVPEEAAIPEF